MDEMAAAAEAAVILLSVTGMPTAAAAVAYEYNATELANAACAGENAWFNADDEGADGFVDDWMGDWDVDDGPFDIVLLFTVVVVLAAVSSNIFNCFCK